MVTQEQHSHIETLAAVSVGDDIEIVRVLLHDGASSDPLRILRGGRQWRCRFSGAVSLLLVSPAGQVVSVQRDAARYIQVRRSASASLERNARHDERGRTGVRRRE